MVNIKKLLFSYKLNKFLAQNSLIFLYHLNSITSKNFNKIKLELLKNRKVKILLIKNNLTIKTLKKIKPLSLETNFKNYNLESIDYKNFLEKNFELSKKILKSNKKNFFILNKAFIKSQFYKNFYDFFYLKDKQKIKKISKLYKMDSAFFFNKRNMKKKLLSTAPSYKDILIKKDKSFNPKKKSPDLKVKDQEKHFKNHKFFAESSNITEFNLIEGPTLIISVKELQEAFNILSITEKNKKLLFIGGKFKEIWWTHLDILKMVNIKKNFLNQSKIFIESLYLNFSKLIFLKTILKYKFFFIILQKFKLIKLILILKK